MKSRPRTSHEMIAWLSSTDQTLRRLAAGAYWEDVRVWFPIATGYTFRGVNITKKDDAWLVVVKAWDRDGNCIVSFLAAAEVHDVWWLTAYASFHRLLTWKIDKWAKD